MGMDPGMDQGLDLDQQIADGVQAFVNSGDPAIAIEVVQMLAQQMGLAPEADFFGGEQADPMAATAGAPAGVPAASGGMRIYRNGGKIRVKKLAAGGVAGPGPKGKTYKRTLPSLGANANAQRNVFTPADFNQGGVQLRPTTQGQGTQLRENKGKTNFRRNIQAVGMAGGDVSQVGGYVLPSGAVAYDYGNRKAELAGHLNQVQFDIPSAPVEDLSTYEDFIPRTPVDAPAPDLAPSTMSGSRPAGKLKQRRMVMGGSDKNDRPTTKYGYGSRRRGFIQGGNRFK